MKLYNNNPASQSRACPEENLTPQASRHTYPLRNMTLVKPATKEGKHEGSQHSHQDRKYTHTHTCVEKQCMSGVNSNRGSFSLPASGSGFLILPWPSVPVVAGGFLPLDGATGSKTLEPTGERASCSSLTSWLFRFLNAVSFFFNAAGVNSCWE